jgi:hypothetical protein
VPPLQTVARFSLPALGAALLSWPSSAWAYCRQTTCERDDCAVDIGTGCVSEGDPLFYDVACLSYAIDKGSAEPLGVSDVEMNGIVMEAFRNWQSVDCPGGGHPSFEIESLGAVDAGGIFFCDEETLNVSVWTLDSNWSYESSSLGYTTSTFVVDSGEIFDADVELNMQRIQSLVPSGGSIWDALLSVATHEAGHFLGLAHSNDRNAVMAASYQNLRPRPLTQDDIAGICELYPPMDGTLECSAASYSQAGVDAQACDDAMSGGSGSDASCSLGRPGHAGSLGAWLVLSLVALGATRRVRYGEG